MADAKMQIDMTEQVAMVSDADKGQISSGRTTATEVIKAQQGKAGRMLTHADLLEKQCMDEINLQLFLLEAYLLTKKERFRHFGQQGDMIMEITPEHYYWKSVPQFRSRGTLSMINDPIEDQQFMSGMNMSMMGAQLGVKFEWHEMYVEMWRRLARGKYSKFIKDQTIPTHNVPQETENMLLLQGQTIDISPANDHQQHLQVIKATKNSPDFLVWPVPIQQRLLQHEKEHGEAMASVRMPGNLMNVMQDGADSLRGQRAGAIQ